MRVDQRLTDPVVPAAWPEAGGVVTFLPLKDEEAVSSDQSIPDVVIDVFDILEVFLVINTPDHCNLFLFLS